MAIDLGFSEESDLDTGFLENLLDIVELDLVGIAFDYDSLRSTGAIELDFRNRKTENGTGVKAELREYPSKLLPEIQEPVRLTDETNR